MVARATELWASKYSWATPWVAAGFIRREFNYKIHQATIKTWLERPPNFNLADLTPSPALSFVFGILTVAGYVRIKKGKGSGGKIIVQNVDKKPLSSFNICFAKITKKTPNRIWFNEKRKSYFVSIGHKHFVESWERRIERNEFCEAIEKFPAYFLRGVFSIRGCTRSKDQIFIVTIANRKMDTLLRIREVLSKLGVKSRIIPIVINGKSLFRLNIHRHLSVLEFSKICEHSQLENSLTTHLKRPRSKKGALLRISSKDEELRRKLYLKKLGDKKMAKLLGIKYQSIQAWRRIRGLKPLGYKRRLQS